jgi:hypothetical protein
MIHGCLDCLHDTGATCARSKLFSVLDNDVRWGFLPSVLASTIVLQDRFGSS